ncbi:unnamed protein product [Trifolium pratense]|uniref:Uncharacterized protein n=1 Tax=Trifolium pratense TaxID=57577 RepID=A0ACB0MD94_TRIPR|nr:unnamed protein product [Trifolium pratense]
MEIYHRDDRLRVTHTPPSYHLLSDDGIIPFGRSSSRELLNEMLTRGRIPNSSTYDIQICGWCTLSYQPEMDGTLKLSYQNEAKEFLRELFEKGHMLI